MSRRGRTVRVEFVSRAEAIDEPVWREFFPAPLEGQFWYHTLETCGLQDQFSFWYARLWVDGRLAGVAPCFLHDLAIELVAPGPVAWVLERLARVFPRVGYQRTFFVGSPCSDEGTIGLAPDVMLGEIIAGLRTGIRAKARELGAAMIVFKDFPASAVSGLTADEGGGGFFRTVSYPGTLVGLPPGSKEAYYRGLTHTQRHNLLKKLRRSRELLALETTIVAQPSATELDEVFGLFEQTYRRGKTKFERLDRRFFERVAAHPGVRFILQRDAAGGGMVAFMLVFLLGDRVVNKFIGLDYGRAGKTFLYFRLFDAALDFAYASGAKEIQSGQTGYRAKFDLGHRPVPLFNVARHDNAVVHAVFRLIGRRISWRSLDPDLAVYLAAHPTSEIGFDCPKSRPRSHSAP